MKLKSISFGGLSKVLKHIKVKDLQVFNFAKFYLSVCNKINTLEGSKSTILLNLQSLYICLVKTYLKFVGGCQVFDFVVFHMDVCIMSVHVPFHLFYIVFAKVP